MQWQEHPNFQKEYAKLARKQRGLDFGYQAAKKLLEQQFNPINPKAIITTGKLHRLTVYDSGVSFWKFEVMVKGLRPGQWPRMWFAVNGTTITFLAVASHTDNYDNNTIDRLALSRYDEIA